MTANSTQVVSETDTFRYLEVTDGTITGTYQNKPADVEIYERDFSGRKARLSLPD
jgi:hypothetical protein